MYLYFNVHLFNNPQILLCSHCILCMISFSVSYIYKYYLEANTYIHRSPPVAHTHWCVERTYKCAPKAHLQMRTKSAPTDAHQERTYRCAPKAHLQVACRCAPKAHLPLIYIFAPAPVKSAPTGAHQKRTYRCAPTGAHQKCTCRCAPNAHLQVRTKSAPTPHLHICTRTKSAPTTV